VWWLTKDGDEYCLEMYRRHYSSHRYADGRRDHGAGSSKWLFIGPGTKVVLRTWEGNAFFAWRKFIDDSGEQGVNCAAFRNESRHLSSELIRRADAIADFLWPCERHYTYVDEAKIRSRNPGYCFLRAGWKRLERRTKSGLRILERNP
jgi:hypothetical protein